MEALLLLAGKARGAVYELSPNSFCGWTETVLYTFTGGADGANPLGGLTFDAAETFMELLFTEGMNNSGVVFELSPNSSAGGTRQPSISFTGAVFTGGPDGYFPDAGLAVDAQGNLYGTTLYGGTVAGNACALFGCGIVFELSPTGSVGPRRSSTLSLARAMDAGPRLISHSTRLGISTAPRRGVEELITERYSACHHRLLAGRST